MSKDNRFSLDDILEEQRRARGDEEAPEQEDMEDLYSGEQDSGGQDEEEYAGDGEEFEEEDFDEASFEEEPYEEGSGEEEFVEEEPAGEGSEEVPYGEEILDGEEAYEPEPETRAEKKRRKKEEKAQKKLEKKQKGFFARRREKKAQKEFSEAEDMYYGIQLKPIDEYTRGFATGEVSLEQEGFRKLFDENTKELDDEVAANFNRLQQERRRRVADAVENAGVDIEQIDEEFGIVAPVPVSAFAGDPYARQHGIDAANAGDNLPEFQKAMLQDAETHTLEFKLDVENDSLDVTQAKVVPEVSEDSVRRILEHVQDAEEENTAEKEVPQEQPQTGASAGEAQPGGEEAAEAAPEQGEEAPENTETGESVETDDEIDYEPTREIDPQELAAQANLPPLSTPVTDVTTYRPRDLPMHVINADVLQSALLTEARTYTEQDRAEREEEDRRAAKESGRLDDAFAGEDEPPVPDETLDDYTGPADAKSVSHDLKASMNSVTLRTLVTGLGAAVLFVVTLLNESAFTEATPAGAAVGYIVTSLIFLLVVIGFNWNTLTGGIKALIAFRPNPDSAASVAAIAVLAQTLCAFLFETELAQGRVHLFTAVAAGALFFNALGKLTLLRRVHSNFRFVASREPKYAVQIFDDYNTSLRLTGDSVASPTIAYQQKAGFLKRYLQISYAPDDAESASQTLAPAGLIASLLLCVAALLLTGDASLALSSLAAACCVCVCVTNMLSINLPVSNLCHKLRRAGAMVSSYEAVRRLSETNVVLVDSEELFPRGSVVLNGVKAFNTEGLEDAVLNASILVHDLGGPLCGVFDQVLQEFENGDLPAVENATYETGSGVVGRVGGHTLLIGSRALLASHGVEPPDPSVESRCLVGDRRILYLAMDGDFYALFSLSYNADERKRKEIENLQENGVTLLVRAMDPNLTAGFIARLFRLDRSNIRVIGAGEEAALDEMATGTAGRVDAYAATKGRMESMLRLITASMDVKKQVGVIVAMQNAAVIIGFVLVALLTVLSGVSRLSTPALFFYEAFWILVMLILPKFIAQQFLQKKKK